jgi:hypothetical protein
LGRRGEDVGPLGQFARAGEEKGRPAWGLAGWARKGEREREFVCFLLFFQISFKFIFQTFTLKSNKNPCTQIMMHKHLFSLNYFSDVYLFKSQFV